MSKPQIVPAPSIDRKGQGRRRQVLIPKTGFRFCSADLATGPLDRGHTILRTNGSAVSPCSSCRWRRTLMRDIYEAIFNRL